MLDRAFYLELLAAARRHSRLAADAEDLLQETLAAALAAGRAPGRAERAWLSGVMRNKAAMQARGAARRRRREDGAARLHAMQAEPAGPRQDDKLPPLPPGLRLVALLAIGGHTRAEIRSLLRISDEALRQRVAELRRRLRDSGEHAASQMPELAGLSFGSIRRGLLPLMRSGRVAFASHDPDGHPIAFGKIDGRPHKTAAGGNRGPQTTKGRVACSQGSVSEPSAST